MQAGLRCGPLTFPNYRLVPDARFILDLPRERVGARSAKRREHGVAIFVLGRKALRRFGFAQGASPRTNVPDPGYVLVAHNDTFAAYVSCPGPPRGCSGMRVVATARPWRSSSRARPRGVALARGAVVPRSALPGGRGRTAPATCVLGRVGLFRQPRACVREAARRARTASSCDPRAGRSRSVAAGAPAAHSSSGGARRPACGAESAGHDALQRRPLGRWTVYRRLHRRAQGLRAADRNRSR